MNGSATRVGAAALIIATAVIEGTDRSAARAAAARVLDPGDGFAFAVCLALLTGRAWADSADSGCCCTDPDCTHVVAVDITGPGGQLVDIEQLQPTPRAALRAVTAAANGDSPAPFLTAVPDEAAALELLETLIHLFEVATHRAHHYPKEA